MEYADIKRLIEDLSEAKIDELEIEQADGFKIKMKKNNQKIIHEEKQNICIPTEEKKIKCKEEEVIISSPMVGTFYASKTPKDEPYVHVGDKVKKGQTLCIIEAMKLMNEIESEVEGTIMEILVKNGETVDFEKPLFKICQEGIC